MNSSSSPTTVHPVIGTHHRGSSSVYALGSTLLPMFLFAFVLVGFFLVMRGRKRRVYAPRTYLETLREDERTPPTKEGMFAWVSDFIGLPDDYVLNHNSLDQFLYLRFLKTITIMSAVGCAITWPLLLPVNASGGGRQSGMDVLSISNVENPNRFYAHAFAAWIFLGFVMLLITRETVYFINLRQAFLMTPLNASRISSRTVLFTDVPDEYLNERQLRTICSSVRRIWLATDCTKLAKLVEDRDEAALKLENAEIKLSRIANKERLKHKTPLSHSEGHDPDIIGSCAAKWIKHNQRPTYRLRPIFGKKVDTINWTRATLPGLIDSVKSAQLAHRNGQKKYIGAVFVEFETQRAAQVAFQMTAHELPLKMQARCIGISPSQILWENLGIKSWQRITRGIGATAFVAAIILFWSVPVAFVGLLSNIDYLTNKIPFLGFINEAPPMILGAIKGLLPTVLLALLVMVVPILYRRLAKMAGAVTQQEVELKTQSWYFAFQVVQVFLIATFSSGASAVTTQILQYPTSAPMLLAQNLPKASNFYISYFVLFGLASSNRLLFNAEGLLKFGFGGILNKTPRKQYKHYVNMSHLNWGSEYPKWANLAVIAIAYSCIAPLVLGFATIGLGLIYMVSRYNSLYTLTTQIDTKGQAYGRALQQLTVGVYLAEICLIGLFAIGIGQDIASVGPMFLMAILLILTALFHTAMRRALHPLTRTLPSSLLTKLEESRYLELHLEEGVIGYSYEGEIRYHSSSDEVSTRPVSKQGKVASRRPSNGGNREEGELNEKDEIQKVHEIVSGIIARSNSERLRSTTPTTAQNSTSTDTMRTTEEEIREREMNKSRKASAEEDAWLRSTATRHTYQGAWGPSLPPIATPSTSSFLSRFLKPSKYASYQHLRQSFQSSIFAHPVPPYAPEVARTAYFHPAIAKEMPMLWIVRDQMGISEQEKRHSRKVLRVEDEGAWFDEEGAICWDRGDLGGAVVQERGRNVLI